MSHETAIDEPDTEVVIFDDAVQNQVHTFVNMSFVLALLTFVALQRNASVDLASLFLKEVGLREAFQALCTQSILLAMTSGGVVLLLHQMELLPDVNCLHVAIECAFLIVLCWLASGALTLRKTQ